MLDIDIDALRKDEAIKQILIQNMTESAASMEKDEEK